MSDAASKKTGEKNAPAQQGTRRFFWMVGGSILIASSLVVISMNWYRTGGTINTDLSLPRYQQYRKDIDRLPVSQTFPSYGELDKKVIRGFSEAYRKEVRAIGDEDYFSRKVVSDEALGIQIP